MGKSKLEQHAPEIASGLWLGGAMGLLLRARGGVQDHLRARKSVLRRRPLLSGAHTRHRQQRSPP
jgi:hypothetical protein